MAPHPEEPPRGPRAEQALKRIAALEADQAELRRENGELRDQLGSVVAWLSSPQAPDPEPPTADAAANEWTPLAPVGLLKDPQTVEDRQTCGWLLTRREGVFREILRVFALGGEWRMDHRLRMPEVGASDGMTGRVRTNFLVTPDGLILGRSSEDTWKPGDETPTWDVDVTHLYEFAGAIDPFTGVIWRQYSGPQPDATGEPDGAILGWWPVEWGGTPTVMSVIAFGGKPYLSQSGMTAQGALELRGDRIFSGKLDYTIFVKVGAPLEPEWP